MEANSLNSCRVSIHVPDLKQKKKHAGATPNTQLICVPFLARPVNICICMFPGFPRLPSSDFPLSQIIPEHACMSKDAYFKQRWSSWLRTCTPRVYSGTQITCCMKVILRGCACTLYRRSFGVKRRRVKNHLSH